MNHFDHDWETLTPLLIHIQANLEGDLSLDALSLRAGLSPFHLHRLFKAAIGETPKEYVSRLRLERGAFRLLIHESNMLDIALGCGYQRHETFIRAFRRRFGKTPSEYREWIREQVSTHGNRSHGTLVDHTRSFDISETKVIRMRPMHLAFRRHIGPYESVPESLFDELASWAQRNHVAGPHVWLGIGHDSPVATPPDQLRFDAAMMVSEPFAPEGQVAYQLLAGGHFAVTTHAGPYDTLPQAYAAIFPLLAGLKGFQIVGLPVVEIYHTARVNIRYELNHTDICLPMEPCL